MVVGNDLTELFKLLLDLNGVINGVTHDPRTNLIFYHQGNKIWTMTTEGSNRQKIIPESRYRNNNTINTLV